KHFVAALTKALNGLLRHVPLNPNLTIVVGHAPPWCVARCLRVLVVIPDAAAHLHVPLRLYGSAHDTKRSQWLVGLHDETGNYRVEWTLSRADLIRVPRTGAKATAAVMQGDARSRHN